MSFFRFSFLFFSLEPFFKRDSDRKKPEKNNGPKVEKKENLTKKGQNRKDQRTPLSLLFAVHFSLLFLNGKITYGGSYSLSLSLSVHYLKLCFNVGFYWHGESPAITELVPRLDLVCFPRSLSPPSHRTERSDANRTEGQKIPFLVPFISTQRVLLNCGHNLVLLCRFTFFGCKA